MSQHRRSPLSRLTSLKSASSSSHFKCTKFQDLSDISRPPINLKMNADANCSFSTSLAETSIISKLSSNHLISIRLPLNLFGTFPSNCSHVALQSALTIGLVMTSLSTDRPSCKLTSSSVIVHSPQGRWNVCVSGLYLLTKALMSEGSGLYLLTKALMSGGSNLVP